MEAPIGSHFEMFKVPYLQNRSSDFHENCCKMVYSPRPFIYNVPVYRFYVRFSLIVLTELLNSKPANQS